MNRQHSALVAAGLSLSFIMPAAIAGPVNLLDYEEVNSSYQSAYINGALNGQSGNQEQSSFDLDLSIQYEKAFSSPDRKTTINVEGNGSLTREAVDDASTTRIDESSTYSEYTAKSSATVDNYIKPGSRAWFVYGKGEVGLEKKKISSSLSDPFTQITAGVGYGRVVNVTPMAKSMRLIKELRTQNHLSRYPDSETYQKIAAIIDRESQYRSRYGRATYVQHWVDAMSTILADTGVVKGGDKLSAQAVLKVYDILVNESITTRKHGWLARGGLGYVLSDYDGDAGDPSVSVSGEYHLPLDKALQLSNVLTLSAVMDNDYVSAENSLTLSYEVNDSLDWENRWLFEYTKNTANLETKDHYLISALRYTINNQLDLSMNAQFQQIDDGIANNGNDDVQKSINLGVSYRLK